MRRSRTGPVCALVLSLSLSLAHRIPAHRETVMTQRQSVGGGWTCGRRVANAPV